MRIFDPAIFDPAIFDTFEIDVPDTDEEVRQVRIGQLTQPVHLPDPKPIAKPIDDPQPSVDDASRYA